MRPTGADPTAASNAWSCCAVGVPTSTSTLAERLSSLNRRSAVSLRRAPATAAITIAPTMPISSVIASVDANRRRRSFADSIQIAPTSSTPQPGHPHRHACPRRQARQCCRHCQRGGSSPPPREQQPVSPPGVATRQLRLPHRHPHRVTRPRHARRLLCRREPAGTNEQRPLPAPRRGARGRRCARDPRSGARAVERRRRRASCLRARRSRGVLLRARRALLPDAGEGRHRPHVVLDERESRRAVPPRAVRLPRRARQPEPGRAQGARHDHGQCRRNGQHLLRPHLRRSRGVDAARAPGAGSVARGGGGRRPPLRVPAVPLRPGGAAPLPLGLLGGAARGLSRAPDGVDAPTVHHRSRRWLGLARAALEQVGCALVAGMRRHRVVGCLLRRLHGPVPGNPRDRRLHRAAAPARARVGCDRARSDRGDRGSEPGAESRLHGDPWSGHRSRASESVGDRVRGPQGLAARTSPSSSIA